ncbi:MAG TPA: type I-C CRISPR-associated protein Cas8c/Csd1 [Lachnospiraceae bacterium]|nr:type I-C CRISPR-associated protein Cas8c/Csd1 [Lachnospiraceae bacterium]
MLISALNDYYAILAEENKVLPKGYSSVKIHYIIELSEDGKIKGIINYQKKETRLIGKNEKQVEVPREEKLPKRTEKPGIEGNNIEHRPLYIFGLNYENNGFSAEDKTNKALKSHEAFCKTNLELIESIDSPIVNAFRSFIINFNPNEETKNPYLLSVGKEYKTAGFAFCLEGRTDILLHKDPQLNEKWNQVYEEKESSTEDISVQCAVSGEFAPISRLHNKIKGFNAMGSVLIGFNNESEESYGNQQAYNSNISKNMMERYTEALNYLLTQKGHKQMLDEITMIYFAMDESEKYVDEFNEAMFGDFNSLDQEETDVLLDNIAKEAKDLYVTKERLNIGDSIDENATFYMFGLKPNSSRLAVKFVYKQKFADILNNIAQHQEDVKMYENSKKISLRRIMNELKPNTNKKMENDPALAEKVLNAVINGYQYPTGLLEIAVRRVKTDQDTDRYKKVNSTRVGIIKACLNRKQRLSGKKEEFNLALNDENLNEAYLCGRLFAVLEKAQLGAYSEKLNRTIKDAYFASACATPAIIFPKLMKLAQYHLAKAEYGPQMNYELGQIMNKLGGTFPTTLPLVEQGKFILGYYQQFYKSNKKTVENSEEDE